MKLNFESWSSSTEKTSCWRRRSRKKINKSKCFDKKFYMPKSSSVRLRISFECLPLIMKDWSMSTSSFIMIRSVRLKKSKEKRRWSLSWYNKMRRWAKVLRNFTSKSKDYKFKAMSLRQSLNKIFKSFRMIWIKLTQSSRKLKISW